MKIHRETEHRAHVIAFRLDINRNRHEKGTCQKNILEVYGLFFKAREVEMSLSRHKEIFLCIRPPKDHCNCCKHTAFHN